MIVLDNLGGQVEEKTRYTKHIPDFFLQAEKHPLKSLPALSAVFAHFCFHPANTSVLEAHKDLGNGVSF